MAVDQVKVAVGLSGGVDSEETRLLSKRLDLPTWDKPSLACLSSRFPYHTKITKAALRQVEKAEDFLWNLGMREFRVRHHDAIARIELGEKELSRFWEDGQGDKIIKLFKSLGYCYVTLDLERYRSGRMNEVLPNDQSTSKGLSLTPPGSAWVKGA